MLRLLGIIIIAASVTLISGCEGCSRSGRENLLSKAQNLQDNSSQPSPNNIASENLPSGSDNRKSEGANVVKMQEVDGVYEIPVSIDGIPMIFIFDTGAGDISISALEASFLYKQGRLTDSDFVGNSDFVDANGNISQGAIINLSTVTIGNKTLHNVRASVVNNLKAPLLFGESALQQFGKITIDFNNKELIFE